MIHIDEIVTEVVVEGGESDGPGASEGGLDAEQLREIVREILLEELERRARTGEDR